MGVEHQEVIIGLGDVGDQGCLDRAGGLVALEVLIQGGFLLTTKLTPDVDLPGGVYLYGIVFQVIDAKELAVADPVKAVFSIYRRIGANLGADVGRKGGLCLFLTS